MKMLLGVLSLSLFNLYAYATTEDIPRAAFGVHTSLVALDLEGPVGPEFRVSSSKSDHVETKIFTAVQEEAIGWVTHGAENVWKAGAGRGASSVNLFLKHGSAELVEVVFGNRANSTFLYLKHDGNKWVQLPKEKYLEEHKKLYDATPSFATIDVSTLDASYPVTHEEFHGSVRYREFRPKAGDTIYSVMDHTQIVWEATEDARDPSNVYVYYHNSEATLVSLYLKQYVKADTKEDAAENLSEDLKGVSTMLFFGKSNGLWKSLLADQFTARYNELTKNVKKPSRGDLTVDVMNMEDSGVEITMAPDEKQMFLEFGPLSETRITKVLAGKTIMWSGSSLSCTSAKVLFKEEEPILAELELGNEDSKIYLEKRTYGWYPLCAEEYHLKVQLAGFATLSVLVVAVMLFLSFDI